MTWHPTLTTYNHRGASPLGNRARRVSTGSFNSLADIEATSPTSRWLPLSNFDQLSVNATLQAT